ncbi:MAG TPA: hypothetical protein ENN02_00625 [Halothiobacillus sp.]|nr:hypothetical protein [Halothiobacillus sp.]
MSNSVSGRLALVFSLLWTAPSLIAEADYLRALEQEAAGALVVESPAASVPVPSFFDMPVGDVELGPGLSKEEFEARLKSDFYGSYVFYSRLSADARARVYEDYLNSPDGGIDVVRDAIIRHAD